MRARSLSAIFLICAALTACAPKGLPPELKPAYTANEVLIRVQELQKTVISLHDATPSQISKPKADLIVKFTILAAETVSATMDGWTTSIKRSWIELNKQLEFDIPEGLAIIWKLVDAMVLAL